MTRLHLFEAFGIELEYMLVDAETLAVKPEADEVLRAAAGSYESEIERGRIRWSNELVLHVIELKTNGPAARLEALPAAFQEQVREIEAILAGRGGRLMPTAMHPWMDPATETRLWPHEYSPVYQAFDRIFGCSGHGWSNLQSLHLNLPFADDQEFGRLHAAIRLLLPLLPALAASSPVVEGRLPGSLDCRLEAYRGNAAALPSVGGEVIPERVFTEEDYRRRIFEPMMREIAPQDPEGVLEEEFLNSRGAIARFGRGSIEIRLIDAQECPLADLAVAALTIAVLRLLTEEHWSGQRAQRALEVAPLARVLRRSIARGERARVDDAAYLAALGLPATPLSAGRIWRHLAAAVRAAGAIDDGTFGAAVDTLLERGPLARRILRRLGPDPDRARLERVYRRLCDCLRAGEMLP
ncbi:MAG: glutamate-cysteine ligase family protein [Acidobacteriota bacterium]|nr:glutamate-cysteine ligase family protein [Acidobacteriota bacterium]